ncbi:MAG TPA: pyroglutamyl-peptidase I [Pseudolabrys sp.]|nr:pyroglutamyl-peptidase I [Pseudolabrys sp.]
MTTLLITGFGPFPGAPYNPTVKLVRALTRVRRPAFSDVKMVEHVFETSYAAVDRELPQLIATHKPDALLMFGLHGRAKTIRIETRARNALALLPDVSGNILRRSVIDCEAPFSHAMPMPAWRLLAAARSAHVPAVLSRDAGRYLCNYLCWRAREAVNGGGPKLAAFVHVPPVRRFARPIKRSVRLRESGDPWVKELDSHLFRKDGASRLMRGNERTAKHDFTAADLLRAGQNILATMISVVNRT